MRGDTRWSAMSGVWTGTYQRACLAKQRVVHRAHVLWVALLLHYLHEALEFWSLYDVCRSIPGTTRT